MLRERSRLQSCLRGAALAVLWCMAAAGSVAAQGGRAPVDTAAAGRGSELTVYLMTIGQGEEIWEKFGHNAIWIHDARPGNDVAYNYGMFSFDQPGFIPRLVQGSMLYWMAAGDARYQARLYAAANRTVWLQELELSPAQSADLRDFLEWNARPENAFYEYKYYRDNCSTRVRDALDRALGGQLRAALESRRTASTYRTETQRLVAGEALASTGLLLAMGQRVDLPLSQWADAFVPMRLREFVADVRVRSADGSLVPLVRREVTLFQSTRPPPPTAPPQRQLVYALIGIAFATLLIAVGRRPPIESRLALAFQVLTTVWSVVIGFFGTIIACLWLFTGHVFTYHNENLLQVNPLPFVLLLALLVIRPGMRRGRTAALALACMIALLSVLGLVLQLLPSFDQWNGGIIGLVLPVHLAVAYVLYRWWRSPMSIHVDNSPPVWRGRTARAAGRHR